MQFLIPTKKNKEDKESKTKQGSLGSTAKTPSKAPQSKSLKSVKNLREKRVSVNTTQQKIKTPRAELKTPRKNKNSKKLGNGSEPHKAKKRGTDATNATAHHHGKHHKNNTTHSVSERRVLEKGHKKKRIRLSSAKRRSGMPPQQPMNTPRPSKPLQSDGWVQGQVVEEQQMPGYDFDGDDEEWDENTDEDDTIYGLPKEMHEHGEWPPPPPPTK